MAKQRTVRKWLECVADTEIREKALRAMDNPDDQVGSLKVAILRMSDWSVTSEGFDYWDEMYHNPPEWNEPTRPITPQEWVTQSGTANVYENMTDYAEYYHQYKSK